MEKNHYLIYGDDEFRVGEKARALVDEYCPPADQTFGLEIIEARAVTESEAVAFLMNALEAIKTTSLLGGRKVVWLRDVNFWTASFNFSNAADETDSAPSTARQKLTFKQAEKAFFAALKAGWPEEHVMVISVPDLDGRLGLLKACKSVGTCVECKQPSTKTRASTESLQEGIQKMWAELGLQPASHQILPEFIERVGSDTRALWQESQKLDQYLGSERRKVEATDIQAVVCRFGETIAWDLSDYIGKRQPAEAIQTLRQLLFQGEAAIKLMVQLEGRFRELIVLRDCMRRGWLKLTGGGNYRKPQWAEGEPAMDEILSQLPRDPRKLHPFRAFKLAEQAEKYTLVDLMRAHQDLTALHEQMISESVDPHLLLEAWILKTVPRPAA